MATTVSKFRINKITKSKFDELVANGTITQTMITNELWQFTDDQFVSQSDVSNWNNKASKSEIPTKISQLSNDSGYAKSTDIPTKISDLSNDLNLIDATKIPTKLSQLTNDVGYANKSDIPTKTSELTNDSNYAKTYELPTKLSDLNNDKGFITEFIESDPTVPSWAKQSTKPSYTKDEIGLGNVENKSSRTILSELTEDDVLNALGYTPVNPELKGKASGYAELDAEGKVPSSQLPSFVDDVLEYNTVSEFPETGESGKIYIAKDTNITYRWGGTIYVEITSSIALGETSSTAFRGDLGKTAYEHSQSAHAPVTAQENTIDQITVNSTTVQPENKVVNIIVPTKLSDLNNDLNFVGIDSLPTRTSQLTNDSEFIKASDIPTNISSFNNDMNYITNADIPTKLSDLTNDKGFITNADIPTKMSDLTNDTGFITESDIPTKTSQLTNDSNFVTADKIPTKTSELINDAGFLLDATIPKIEQDLSSNSTTNAVSVAGLKTLLDNLRSEVLKAENPVGHIRIETTDTNPSTYLGFGTWELWGSGKVPIGVNTSDTDFATVEKSGGSKSVNLAHTHTSAAHTHSINGHTHSSTAHTHSINSHTHSSAAHTHSTGDHVLTTDEMPAHHHGQRTIGEDGNINPWVANKTGTGYGVYTRQQVAWYGSGSNKLNVTTYDYGSGEAHNHGNTGSTTPGSTGGTSLTTNSTTPGATGSTSLTTNSTTPGATGSALSTVSTVQPYITCYMWKRTA